MAAGTFHNVSFREIAGQPTCLVLSLSAFGAFLFQCQIAQFDCSISTSEEADEARPDRNNPGRIGSGQNPDVDEPSLQHSTAKCTGKPKSNPKNKDERRLQASFIVASPGAFHGAINCTPLERSAET